MKEVFIVGTFILIVLFYLFYALISFVIVYAGDTADIANYDFKSYTPSISDLSEEERTSIYTIDNYIKSTICPRYHYQILRSEIKRYQEDNMVAMIGLLFLNMSLTIILLKTLNVEKWLTFHFIVTTVINFMCSFVVWLLYQKYSSYRIIGYYEFHSSYDWESHYDYLWSKKENIIFRHTLRNTIFWLALVFFIFVKVYYSN